MSSFDCIVGIALLGGGPRSGNTGLGTAGAGAATAPAEMLESVFAAASSGRVVVARAGRIPGSGTPGRAACGAAAAAASRNEFAATPDAE